MNKQTLFQRFASETPAFEKGAQIISLILVAIAGHLGGILSPTLINDITVAGAAIAFCAQFASKELATIAAAPTVLDGIAQAIPDILSQFADLKTTLTGTVANHTDQLSAIAGSLSVLASPPAAVPVQSQPPAPGLSLPGFLTPAPNQPGTAQ
jgi:hypothetical protein